jgi:hypothetical protein
VLPMPAGQERKPAWPTQETTAQDGRVIGQALGVSQHVADAPAVRKYQCTRGGKFIHNGMSVTMRVGKVFDSQNFDLRKLKAQGIAFEEFVE